METTKIIVEYLVSGVLIVIAVIFLVAGVFPLEFQWITSTLQQSTILLNQPILIVVVSAIIYSVGILFESIGQAIFEVMLDRCKIKRLATFIQSCPTSMVAESTILNKFKDNPSEKWNHKKITEAYGLMRFYVMLKNNTLSTEIETQMNRVRLMRVMFLSEVIFLVASFIHATSKPTFAWISAIVCMIAIIVMNWNAINTRFERYCRAIERSYKTLYLHESDMEPLTKHTEKHVLDRKAAE